MTTIETVSDQNETFLDGLGELEWLDDVTEYTCTRCQKILVRHYISNCEHKFCKDCARRVGDGSQQCPRCNEYIGEIVERRDSDFGDIVSELKLHCPNRKYGCEHTGPLKDLKEHLEECEHGKEAELPVPLTGKPDMLVEVHQLRKEVQEMKQKMLEMQKICCDRDETDRVMEERKWAETNERVGGVIHSLQEEKAKREEVISNVSKNLHEKVEHLGRSLRKDLLNRTELNRVSDDISYVNVRTDVLQAEVRRRYEDTRSSMLELLRRLNKRSNKTEVQVKMFTEFFYVVGDEKKTLKGNINNAKLHENTQHDIALLKIFIRNLEEKFFHLETYNRIRNHEMNSYTLAENKANFQPDFAWKINGITDKLSLMSFEEKSEEFDWTGYPVRARVKMEVKDSRTYFSLRLEKNNNKGESIDIKPLPSVYYVLKDQSGNVDSAHESRARTYSFPAKFDYGLTYDIDSFDSSELTAAPYNSDDSIVLEIYVEPSEIARSVHSHDGTLFWAMDHFWKRAESEKRWAHESPYFYTGPKGYRVQVKMWFAEHLLAFVFFLPGEFDSDLPLTFPHETTITLLDRKDPQRSITRTVHETEFSYLIGGWSEEEVENVMEMETIFYKVTIKPSN